jgi:hypothetical protein
MSDSQQANELATTTHSTQPPSSNNSASPPPAEYFLAMLFILLSPAKTAHLAQKVYLFQRGQAIDRTHYRQRWRLIIMANVTKQPGTGGSKSSDWYASKILSTTNFV